VAASGVVPRRKKTPPAAAAAAAETEEIRAGAGHLWTVDRAKGTETSG